MLRIRFILMSLFAVVAVSALASASASAIGRLSVCEKASVAGGGQWNNPECTSLGGSKEYETKEETTGELKGTGGVATLKGEIAKAEVIITCAKSKITGVVEAAGAAKGESVFEECGVGNSKEKFVNCEVPNIKTPFKSQLIEEGGELRDEFKGTEAGGRFTTVKINNKGEKTCLEKGSFEVTGTTAATLPRNDIYLLGHLFDFIATIGNLHFGGSPATFVSSIFVFLLRTVGLSSYFVAWSLLH
jgi:hypothetical protein